MNKDDVLLKLKEDIALFKTLDKEFYKDKDICYYALTQNTKLVKYVDESLLDDYDFILKLSENKINHQILKRKRKANGKNIY